MREYKASFDMVSRIITAGVAVLFLAMNAYSIYNFHNLDENVSFVPLILSFPLTVGIFIGCYLFHPAKYVVTNDMVIVKRPFKDKQFHRSKLKDAFLVDKGKLGWVIRTFGVGGLFGYFGRFRSEAFGPMTWYATRRNNYLVIETKSEKRILLTPDDTSMINEIRALIGKV